MIPRLPIQRLSISALPRTTRQSPPRCLNRARSALSILQYRKYSTVPPPPPRPSEPPTSTIPPRDLRSQISPSPPTPPSSSSKRKHSLRPYIYATICTLIGLSLGSYTTLLLAPPPLPPASSASDTSMVSYLHDRALSLPIVRSLSSDPNWTYHDAYTSLPSSTQHHHLTTGPLAGARALGGFQRVFVNEDTGEVVTVLWFGGAVAGWPGVVHGGLSATVLDEVLGRCAIRVMEGKTGVTARLELRYLKPVLTNGFYVVRAGLVEDDDDGARDDDKDTQEKKKRKRWVQGRLETLNGEVCVEAKALFVVPKAYKTASVDRF